MRKPKTEIKDNWRVCTHCLQFKEWFLFSKDKTNKTWYTTNCLECRQNYKKEYRKTYIWKIIDKNNHIKKRADREYRQREYRLHKEYYQKNKEKFKINNYYYKKNKKLIAEERKIREYNYYLQWEFVIYNNQKCKILQDYIKWKWVLIQVNEFKLYIPKYKLKPYKEKRKYIFE